MAGSHPALVIDPLSEGTLVPSLSCFYAPWLVMFYRAAIRSEIAGQRTLSSRKDFSMHVSRLDLERLVVDQLPNPELSALQVHLQECRACQVELTAKLDEEEAGSPQVNSNTAARIKVLNPITSSADAVAAARALGTGCGSRPGRRAAACHCREIRRHVRMQAGR